MGKPRYGDVCELPVACDFSQVGLDEAMEELRPRGRDIYGTVTLSANADGLIKAIDLCRLYNLELGFSTTYERDEWSLEYLCIDPPRKHTCWTPGA